MEFLGNVFTHYNYTTIDLRQTHAGTRQSYESSNFNVLLDLAEGAVSLPTESPFTDWKEARRFAGPLPFTFRFDAAAGKVLIIEGARENWTPRPIKVLAYHFSFLDSLNIEGAVLANAFVINNVPYSWKKGKQETWK